MYYFIPLIIIYFFIGFFENAKPIPEEKRKLRTFVLLIPMWALTAFRADFIGCDTPYYAMGYVDAQFMEGLSNQLLWSRMESGYVFFRYIFIHYGFSFFVFQIFTTTFIYYSLFRFISKYSPNIGLSCFLFIITCRMFSTMNQTRMWMAIAILLFSVQFLLERKFVKFIFTVFLAYLFHKSALIFVIMYPLCTLKQKKWVSFMIILGSMVISFLGIRFMGWFTDTVGVYGNYIDNIQFSEDRSTLATTMNLLEVMAFFILFYYTGSFRTEQFCVISDKRKICVELDYYMKMSFYIFMGFVIIGLSNNIMSRVSSYFSIIMLLMLPASLQRIRGKDSLVIYALICIMLAAEFGVKLIYRPYWYEVTPYAWGFNMI